MLCEKDCCAQLTAYLGRNHTPSVSGLRKQIAGHRGTLKKLLVANRGEIAIRILYVSLR